MYFEDLTQYQFIGNAPCEKILNVGWLDEKHPFRQERISDDFLEKLFGLCLLPVNKTRGYHQCPFCTGNLWGLEVVRNNQKIILGSAEIRVVGDKDIIYASPDLIYHYVEAHKYHPPDEFIETVLSK